jgi:uncharacterized protein (DUF1697 family)
MTDLTAIVSRLGYASPKTLLQSGNIVFGSGGEAPAQIEERIARALADALSLQSDVFVRTLTEWTRIVSANPFPAQANDDPSHLVLMTLRSAPARASVAQLQAAVKGPETLQAVGRQLYLVYPDGIGRSKLTGTVIERSLGTRGTARNWNTVLKLAALGADVSAMA